MANLLKMATRETIRTLHHRDWSQRRIADELGINREIVARCHRALQNQPLMDASKPATTLGGLEHAC